MDSSQTWGGSWYCVAQLAAMRFATLAFFFFLEFSLALCASNVTFLNRSLLRSECLIQKNKRERSISFSQ